MRFDDVEAAGARHLDVEKHQIGFQPADGIDGFDSGWTLGDDFDPVLGAEQHAQTLTRQRLIVGDENAHFAVRHAT